ncbi:hypothetical protein [Gottfriedia solisilvae]|uniref:hypothetical protein n=1 Tax=Gottfriedia solisilvae TaxID=1516104 RepID=UPI003D2F2AAA
MKTITLPINQIEKLKDLLNSAFWEIEDGRDFIETLLDIDFDGSLQERIDNKEEIKTEIKESIAELEALLN